MKWYETNLLYHKGFSFIEISCLCLILGRSEVRDCFGVRVGVQVDVIIGVLVLVQVTFWFLVQLDLILSCTHNMGLQVRDVFELKSTSDLDTEFGLSSCFLTLPIMSL